MSTILNFPCGVERLSNGNTLICDAGTESGADSKILEVAPDGRIGWSWPDGLRFVHSCKELGSGNRLIADTTNDRILEIDASGQVVFSSDDWAGGTGRLSDGSHLRYPNNVQPLENGLIVVTDRNNSRFVVVDREGNASCQLGEGIKHPHNCEQLENGHFIIANSDEDFVLEVDAEGSEVWRYGDGLDWPRDANRLENGNTLIADSRNSRVIEVTPEKRIVWEYRMQHFANVYEAHRLANGNTLISDQQHKQVIEVNPGGDTVWRFHNYERHWNSFLYAKESS